LLPIPQAHPSIHLFAQNVLSPFCGHQTLVWSHGTEQ
jgi:hypothetical protein